MRFFASLLVTLVFLLALPPACGEGGGGSAPGTGTVIVGVTSDLRAGVDVASLHVVMRADGEVVRDERRSAGSGPDALTFPAEIPFTDLPDGTRVEAMIEAYRPGDATTPLVTRLASTDVVGGEKLLLRVAVDSRCVVAPGSSAPTCAAPETCVAGQCQDAWVDPGALRPYTEGWGDGAGDPCKPANAGPAVVIVGEGQADYLPMDEGAVAQVEAGPQGGHHIWVALRAKNLTQSGSVTSVTGHFPDLDIDVGPFAVIFTLEPDEGGFCKLYGLRFQLDTTVAIDPLLGHPLDVKVTVTDANGDVGVGTRSVVLSDTYLQ